MKKTVGVLGFYGAGNLGDEAMLLALAGWLESLGCGVAVYAHDHEASVLDGYRRRGWGVYDQKDRRSVAGLSALVIGGGSLGPGYGWHLLPTALRRGVPVLAVGQSYGREWVDDDGAFAVNAAVLDAHKFLAPRDKVSVNRLARWPVSYGADPALALAAESRTRQDLCLLFVRHREYLPGDEQLLLARSLLGQCRLLAGRVVLGCCCRGDLEFAWEAYGADVPEVWHFTDPHDCLRRVASARVCVAAHRMHPVVFACAAGTPCVAVPAYPGDKMSVMALECGAAVCFDAGAVGRVVPKIGPAGPARDRLRDVLTAAAAVF